MSTAIGASSRQHAAKRWASRILLLRSCDLHLSWAFNRGTDYLYSLCVTIARNCTTTDPAQAFLTRILTCSDHFHQSMVGGILFLDIVGRCHLGTIQATKINSSCSSIRPQMDQRVHGIYVVQPPSSHGLRKHTECVVPRIQIHRAFVTRL